MRLNTLIMSVTIIKISSSTAVRASAADKSSLTPKDAAKLFLASLPRMLFTFSHSSISPMVESREVFNFINEILNDVKYI